LFGISVDSKIWAIENINDLQFIRERYECYRNVKQLDRTVWQYINLSLGRPGDTYNYGN